MNMLDPRIAHHEIDRRLRTADRHRWVRRARAASTTQSPTLAGCRER